MRKCVTNIKKINKIKKKNEEGEAYRSCVCSQLFESNMTIKLQ